ncbi:MAG TPA: cyclic nucleotide-binding domain-containing protein [Kofleriaceae bacterium]|nr:cyclic nucleotide-binding domain-containing protein [Kofleriaceae bacterium]
MIEPLVHPFFAGLPAEHQQVLARVVRRQRVPPGQRLFEQGDPADSALFVERGRVELSVRMPGGGVRPLAVIEAGEVLGELALVERHRRSASAQAVGELEALVMHRDDLRALCAHYDPASLAMLRSLAELVARRVARVNHDRAPDRGAPPAEPVPTSWRAGADFEVRRFLPALSLFRRFTAADIDELYALGQVVSPAAGEIVVRYGEPAAGCFIVVRGALQVHVPTASGPRRVGVLGPGAIFGEVSTLLDLPRSATCSVRERATLLALPTDALATLRDPHRHVSFRFHEALVRSLMARLERVNRALTGERRLRHPQ